MLLQSEIAFVVASVALVIIGFALAPNRSRFLLAAGVMTIAWQGGYWGEYFNMDFTLTYFIFALLFVWNFIDPRSRFQLKGSFPVPLYFWMGVIVFCALAITPAIQKYPAWSGVARAVIDVMIFFAVLKSLHSAGDIQYFIGTLMAAMLFQSILALVQFKFPFFQVGVIDQSQSWMWWRTKGTFFHANEMGMYTLLMLPITARVLFFFLLNDNRKWVYFSGMALLIGGLALFTTANRGSWIGFSVGIVFMLGYDFFRRGVKLKKLLLGLSIPAMILLVIFALKYGSTFAERLFSTNATGSIEGRVQYQAEALAIINAHPIMGVGYGNYLNHVSSYFVHNTYLLIGAEIGIPGLMFVSGFLLVIFGQIIKGMRSKIFFISNLSRGCFATLVGFLIASIPGPDFWISHPVQMYFWMIVVLPVALLRLERQALAQLKMRKQRSRNEAGSQIPGANEFSAGPAFERNTVIGSSFSDINKRQT